MPDAPHAEANEVERFERSLGSLRVLLLLSVVVPLLIYGGFGVYRWHQIHDEAQARLDRLLGVAREHALKIFESNEAILAHALSLGQTAGPDPGAEAMLHAQLKELSLGKPQIQSIFLVGADARPMASDRAMPTPRPDVSGLDYMQWHLGGTRPAGSFFTQLNVGRVTREPFFAMSRAAYAADGKPRLVALVSMRPAYFAEFHSRLTQSEPGLAVTMFRSDGVVYSRWPQLPGQPPRMADDSAVMQGVRRGETNGQVKAVSSLDGQPRYIQFEKVGNYPVYLGTGLQLSAVRAAWTREMAWIAAFAALPVLGLLLAAWLALRRTRDALDGARRLREESIARRQIEEALLQSQKLEALGRLTGGVAHDFNNALMVISGNLQLIRMTQAGGSTRFTDAIGRAVESATKLTRQLLAFSRRQPLLPQRIVLQQRLPPLKDLLAPVLGSQVTLSVDVDARTPPIEVDVAELELGLINLAVNARDAMTGVGSFTLRAAPVLDAPADAPPSPTGWVLLEAVDTGTGIPPEQIAKVFEPFFTTKAVGQGTGLGLSQVYALCKRSRGAVTIASAPGQGTTVRLYFPAAQGEASRDEGMGEVPSGLGLTVLVVEDNEDVARTVQPVLEAMGCSVHHLPRADVARDWLAARDALPDVLLTDVVMPGALDGLALAQEVRARYPGMHIIVMTGYAEQLDSIARHGFQVLPKPWTAEMLAGLLARRAGAAPATAAAAGGGG